MQRRAAALYGAFFLVLALGSYGMIAAASAPTVSVANPDHRLAGGDQLTVEGRTYNVSVDGESATLTWTNPSADYTTTWEDGSDVEVGGTNYTVSIPDSPDPQLVELTEIRTLPADVQTTEVNGTEYVVVERDGTRQLVRVSDYLNETAGPAATRSLTEREAFDYRGNLTTVRTVENESATLGWRAPRAVSVEVSEGDVVTLNGVEFVAHFPDAGGLVLDRDIQAYEHQVEVVDTYEERVNGLWGVSILSGLAVVFLLGLAYLPSRY
ncbi:MAG: hypothetical protein ABEJ92_11595 [Halobacteriales archaeon]